jgi:hypothetical protein
MSRDNNDAAAAARIGRVAGAALIAASILSVVALGFDPEISGHDSREILQGIIAATKIHQAVHIAEMLSLGGFAFGFISLAQELGLRRVPVLAGLVAYLAGCLAMLGATVLDGFVTPDIAAGFIHRSPAEIDLGLSLVRFTDILLQNLADLSFVLLAAGTLLWSLALIAGRVPHRVTGAIGLVSGIVPIILVVLHLDQDPTSLIMVLIAQSAWNIAAAILLLRREPAAWASGDAALATR